MSNISKLCEIFKNSPSPMKMILGFWCLSGLKYVNGLLTESVSGLTWLGLKKNYMDWLTDASISGHS